MMIVYYWSMERYTPLARSLLMAWVVLISLSFLPGISLVDYWAVALTVIFSLSWIFTLGFISHIDIKYFIPANIREGNSFKLKILMKARKSNHSNYSAIAYRTHEAFVVDNENLEWIKLDNQSQAQISLNLSSRMRGVFPIYGLSLVKNQSFGLMRKSGFYEDIKEVVVWAKQIEISSKLVMDLVNTYTSLNISSSQHDFAGVREYQPGDRMRDLHHKTWAKRGEPYTKIFEAPESAQLNLMIDAAPLTRNQRYLWEPFLQIASALGNALIAQDLVKGMLVAKNEVYSNKIDQLKVEWDNAIAHLPLAAFKEMPNLSLDIPKEYESNLVFSCGESLKWVSYLKEHQQNTSLKVVRLISEADEYMDIPNLINITLDDYFKMVDSSS